MVIAAVGVQLAIVTTVNERKEQTLAFVMSIPVSWHEYRSTIALFWSYERHSGQNLYTGPYLPQKGSSGRDADDTEMASEIIPFFALFVISPQVFLRLAVRGKAGVPRRPVL